VRFPRRLAITFGAVVLCFAALAVRLARIQVFAGEEFRLAGAEQAAARVEVPEPRGEIRDAHGSPLAYSEKGFDLWADATRVGPLERASGDVAGALETDGFEMLRLLAGAEGRVCLGRGLAMEEAERVRALNVRGLALDETWRRRYPLGRFSVHLLGVVGRDGVGLEGLEFAWDEVLSGRSGRRRLREDGHRRMIDLGREPESPGIPGAHLVLTVDAGIQRIVGEEMDRQALKIRPLGGAAVVMDPSTGDVKALVSWPVYEPGARGSASPSQSRNRAVQDSLEPGSTFKPFIVARAIEQGAVSPGARIDCEDGQWRVLRDRVVHDSHPRGTLSIEEILVYSSNIGAAKIGRKLGADRMLDALRVFGFCRKPGSGLPGEANGIVRPRTAWSPHTVISMSFGQELAVTPLQLVTGYAALVNGGLRVRPRVIDRLLDGKGRALREFPRPEPERVLSEATSRWVRDALRRVVEDGTGRRARTSGLAIGGKTGTAQKYERDPRTGRMRPSRTKVVASFAGFAPAAEPRLVCLVTWDEPERARSGGAAAAPVVARILKRAFGETGAGGSM
jgi:cell division protein FtsI (penicillin-binding protein 3)